MEQLKTRQFAGIDLGRTSAQFSLFDEGQGEMMEEIFPLEPDEQKEYIASGMAKIRQYMESANRTWEDFDEVNISLEGVDQENRKTLEEQLPEDFQEIHATSIITRFRAFAEYVFHQERSVWDRNTLLLDFSEGRLTYIFVEQIRRARQRAYRAILKEIDTEEFGIQEGDPELDQNFSKMMKQFLVRKPAHIIYLTGQGFEGSWMKRSLTYMCAGRRVFLGQNLYANGACLLGMGELALIEDGMLLMEGPEMVSHTIGVITQESGKAHYVPITSIGKEWYNTSGSLDIIMDKSQKVEFFFHNSRENEIECSACEIRDLPGRPPKTTRLRIKVEFTSQAAGVILITDMGFGSMFPATGKVTIFPFQLIT
ncbi:MAG: hypothetical protein IJ137_10800 [Eubacterium sp.]|nr:hypothetical protein [Eubacterium sp.]